MGAHTQVSALCDESDVDHCVRATDSSPRLRHVLSFCRLATLLRATLVSEVHGRLPSWDLFL